jgi:hypothetical protein
VKNSLEALAQSMVADRELCLQLKSLGFNHLTFFYWLNTKSAGWQVVTAWDGVLDDKDEIIEAPIPAPSVSELGDLLPEYVGEWFLEMYKDISNLQIEEHFLVRYVEKNGLGGETIIEGFNEQKEANARVRMVIWLIENKYIKI